MKTKQNSKRKNRLIENLQGYVFIGPAFLIISLFGIFPVLYTVFVSLHKWRILKGPFLGLKNFTDIFGAPFLLVLTISSALFLVILSAVKAKFQDSRAVRYIGRGLPIGVLLFAVFYLLPQIYARGDNEMLDSLRVTMWYSFGTVPIQLGGGLIVAVFLDQKFRGKQFFRVVFLLPYIVPSVASAAVFERLFSLRSESFANQFLISLGAKPLQWLMEPKGIFTMFFGFGAGESQGALAEYLRSWVQGPSLALVSIMFFNWWVFIGYYALIFANGLAQIPRQLYEAAEIDGAPKRTVFFKIILPLLSPTTFFLTLLGIIGTFKAFNHIYVLRSSAVKGAVDPISVQIFFTFFRKSRFGYASAMSLILFFIVLALTLFQRRTMEKKVHYGE